MYLDLKRQKQLGVTFNTDEHQVVLTVNFIIGNETSKIYFIIMPHNQCSTLLYAKKNFPNVNIIFPKS